MKKALLLVAVLFIAVSGLTSCSGIDPWRLQGTWEASTTIGEATIVTHRLVIDGDTFDFVTLSLIPTGKSGTFSVDAFSSPKTIDLMVTKDYIGEGSLQVTQAHDPAVAVYGIYQISDGVLKIQLGDEGGNRPVSFDDGQAVTLSRVSTN